MATDKPLDSTVLGGGCFWCTQAVFDQLQGVHTVTCGYSGGQPPQPTYEQICTGQTGHAECVRITFDSDVISFADLLQVFFQTHDPTTLNRQGNDVGTQYRSVVFFQNDRQQRIAQETMAELDAAGAFPSPIVTELAAAQPFYDAETYHQGYFDANQSQPYCSAVIRPKLDKFRTQYRDLLKKSSQ